MSAAEGRPVGLGFDGLVRFLWWGEDGAGRDLFATGGGRMLTFGTEADCRAAAVAAGWPVSPDDGPADVSDLEPAQAWLRGRRMDLDVAAALGLWNWAIDAAANVGLPWADRGGARDRCYRKLFAATVPWVFERDAYRPTWNRYELRTLRATLGSAVHVLRGALVTSSSASR